MLATLYVIAAEAPGRGGNPDEGWGVLTIVGFILLMALVIAAAGWALIRVTRRNAASRDAEHPPGSVGRTG